MYSAMDARHAVEQHQVEPVHVDAVADHAGRDDGLDLPAGRADVLQGVGDLVEGGLALELGDGQLVQAMLPQVLVDLGVERAADLPEVHEAGHVGQARPVQVGQRVQLGGGQPGQVRGAHHRVPAAGGSRRERR